MIIDVAFLIDLPGLEVVSIGDVVYNDTWENVKNNNPAVFFEADDEDGIWDPCMKWDDAQPLPVGTFILNGETHELTAEPFVRGRPPKRPKKDDN